MALTISAVVLAIVLDVLIIWAWRHRRNSGQWPGWPKEFKNCRLSLFITGSKSTYSNFTQQRHKWARASKWFEQLPELSLL